MANGATKPEAQTMIVLTVTVGINAVDQPAAVAEIERRLRSGWDTAAQDPFNVQVQAYVTKGWKA